MASQWKLGITKHRIAYGPDTFLIYEPRGDGNVEIVDIQVQADKRRQGLGRKMVSQLLNDLDPDTVVYAITRADNEIAQQWYEALQFRTSIPLRRFYGADKGVDAIMYLRKAGGPV